MHIKIEKKKNTFDNSGKLTIHRYLIMKNKKLYFELRMKLMKNLRTFTFFMLVGAIAFTTSSCSDDDDSTKSDYGTVTGMVTDENNTPISGVAVTISDVEGSTATGADGKYSFSNAPMDKRTITFTKKDYLTTSATVLASKFDANKVASISIQMLSAAAKVMGTVTDAKNNNAPLAGVTVKLGSLTTTTANDGTYLFESLIIDDYSITFSKTGYVAVSRDIKKAQFIDKITTLDIRLGGVEVLPGLTADDLKEADKWLYNEYRGGKNADSYPHWDWSTDYMCTLSFWGNMEEQNEGTTLRIRNTGDEQKNPANLDAFDSYTYGSKKITEDNKILSLRIRTHNADDKAPAYFGVQVVDLSAAEPVAVKVGETKTCGSQSYTDYDFDLSDYVGKEVIIAIGIYRTATGDYWKQLVLRAIRFAPQKVEGWNWLPGTAITGLEEWKLTAEMVRSTMVQTTKSFTGISPIRGGSGDYYAAYREWRNVNHIAYCWAFMPTVKDPEVFPSEGYLIKTTGNGAANTNKPEAYFYAKFAIAEGNNKLTLKTRTFGDQWTFFKLTAIKEDGTFVNLNPISNMAKEAAAAENGCWKFKHDAGGPDNPNTYATFVYDLAQFNGSNVVLAIGVFNGEKSSNENKLVFHSVELN